MGNQQCSYLCSRSLVSVIVSNPKFLVLNNSPQYDLDLHTSGLWLANITAESFCDCWFCEMKSVCGLMYCIEVLTKHSCNVSFFVLLELAKCLFSNCSHGVFSAISCMCFPVALEDVLHPASHPGGICLKDMFRVGDALTLPFM